MQRRTPRSGKQKKAQLQAERRRRAAGPCEEEAAAASEAQEAAVRAYHVDACGYRWRRSAEDAVLVGMVVQRARGGGVVVRLGLRPDAVTGAAPAAARAAAAAAAAAADPLQQSCKRLQARMRQCDGELSSLARFKPSEVGGQRWRHEASRWAVLAHRVAAIGVGPGTARDVESRPEAPAASATSALGTPQPLPPSARLSHFRPRHAGAAAALGAKAEAATELFLLLQHALQAPLDSNPSPKHSPNPKPNSNPLIRSRSRIRTEPYP